MELPKKNCEFGCYRWAADWEKPDECVLDTGSFDNCDLVKVIRNKKQCKYWQPVKEKRNDYSRYTNW